MSGPFTTHLTAVISRAPHKMLLAAETIGNIPHSLADLKAVKAHLLHILEGIERKLSEWTFSIGALPADQREPEQQTYNNLVIEGKSPTQWTVDIGEKIVDLNIIISGLEQQPPAPPIQPPLPNGGGNGVQITLPSIQLPEFSGDPAHWFGFWEAFNLSIGDNANISEIHKITYLFSLLKSSARSIVEGLPMTAASYPIAISLLKNRFGDEARRAEQLQNELVRLPKAPPSLFGLRNLSESIERICRQLFALGVNMNENPFLTTTLKSKLPLGVLTRLVAKELDSNTKWTPEQWRQGLLNQVQILEAASWDRDLRDSSHNHKNQGDNSTTHCSLCGQSGHQPLNCPKYATPLARKRRIQEQRRCFICLRSGHSADRCRSESRCTNCGNAHHVMICLKRRADPDSDSYQQQQQHSSTLLNEDLY